MFVGREQHKQQTAKEFSVKCVSTEKSEKAEPGRVRVEEEKEKEEKERRE